MASRVLVTGGASGIGEAICGLLRDDGVEAIAADVAPGAEVELDVTDEDGWDRAVAEVGDFDGLVNCAGIRGRISPIAEMSVEDFQQVVDVNVLGVFLGTRAAVRAWRGHGGAIVNVASRQGLQSPIANQSHYAGSKGAVIAFTYASAVELAPVGIRVNAIAPGPIATPLLKQRLPDESFEAWMKSRVPMERFGEPSEAASVVAFLLSDRASYLTGTVLSVDGGLGAM